jgi:protein transport protein SEC23
MRIFNSSPDSTTAIRYVLLLEDVINSLFMIQPSLHQYKLDRPPVRVMLNTSSSQPIYILLLDTFFRVLIWYTTDMAA